MEDAHAAVLDLDADDPTTSSGSGKGGNASAEQRNSFFAVYDGHGGALTSRVISLASLTRGPWAWYITGSSVARFSGDTVHHRLRATSEYKAGEFEPALKRAFLATDEDLRESEP